MDRCVPAKLASQIPLWQFHRVPSSLALPLCRCYNKRPRKQHSDSNTAPFPQRIQHREAHTRRTISSAAVNVEGSDVQPTDMPSLRPLASVPLSSLVRSYLITSISSVPLLLQPSLA